MADVNFDCNTGHEHGQLTGVLSPRMRSPWDERNWFWLSAPSDEADVNHTLRFKLAHSLCLVHKVQIQPLLVDLAVRISVEQLSWLEASRTSESAYIVHVITGSCEMTIYMYSKAELSPSSYEVVCIWHTSKHLLIL